MPPSLFLVRHGEAEHNVTHDPNCRDAELTKAGKAQSARLRETFKFHDSIDLIVASPLRRTLQTAILAFGANNNAEIHLLPEAHEVSGMPCNVGFLKEELKEEVKRLFKGDEESEPAVRRVIHDAVVDGWNSKEGIWGPDNAAATARAAKLRAWLYARPEKNIVVVTHGAFLHYLTEDWSEPIYFAGKASTGQGTGLNFVPPRGTSYANCEVRRFSFTKDFNERESHLVEDESSKMARRGWSKKEETL